MNTLGSNYELVQNKLILLYVIDKLGMPISNPQLTKVILENKFMNYFLLQQFLLELCDDNLLLVEEKEETNFYNITLAGKQTLGYFINRILPGIKRMIDESIASIRKNIKNETLTTAEYIPHSETQFTVNCKVHEDKFSLIDVGLSVGTKSEAIRICENWKKYSQAIYAEIIESLLKNRDDN